MAVSMHSATAPVFVQVLTALSGCLDKAAAHCEAKKIDPNALLQMRLAPDMYTLAQQVQQATNHAVGAVARPAGMEPPAFAGNEASFADLKARVASALDFVKSVPASKVDGTEAKPVELKFPARTLNFTAQNYAMHFALPNFFFHATTAYDILRHAGVEVGKRDFIGQIPS